MVTHFQDSLDPPPCRWSLGSEILYAGYKSAAMVASSPQYIGKPHFYRFSLDVEVSATFFESVVQFDCTTVMLAKQPVTIDIPVIITNQEIETYSVFILFIGIFLYSFHFCIIWYDCM